MHVRMPRLVESHVGSAREGCGAQHHHPAPQDAASPASPRYPTRTQEGGGDTPSPNLPGAPQSQHCLFPGMFFTSLMTSLVSSCTPPSVPPPAAAPPPLGSPLKALLRASSLLFCSTETHLGRGNPGQEEEEEEEDPEPQGAGTGCSTYTTHSCSSSAWK